MTNARALVVGACPIAFDEQRLEDDEIFISSEQYNRFVKFGAACKDTTWLPAASIADSMAKIDIEFRKRGDRLKDAPALTSWQNFGYFRLSEDDPTIVVCNLDPSLNTKLNFSAEALLEFDDWKIMDNWSTSAYLHSKSAGEKSLLRNLFVKKFGQDKVDAIMPLEKDSFEPDGKALPAWLCTTVGVKTRARPKSGMRDKKKAAMAKAKSVAAKANAIPIKKRRPPAGTGVADGGVAPAT